MRHNEYELMQLRQIMKILQINKNNICKQCKSAPTFKSSTRCYGCVLYEMSVLMHAFNNALEMIYTFNEQTVSRGRTFAKVMYSSICWTVNVANFTKYFDTYGNPIDWIPEIQEFVKPLSIDSHLDKHEKPLLQYHIDNGVKEPVYENAQYYTSNETDFLLAHLNWIYN